MDTIQLSFLLTKSTNHVWTNIESFQMRYVKVNCSRSGPQVLCKFNMYIYQIFVIINVMVTKFFNSFFYDRTSSCQPVVIIMLNQSSFGGMPATSALLPGFPPNNPGLMRTLLPGHHHPNVSMGLEVSLILFLNEMS